MHLVIALRNRNRGVSHRAGTQFPAFEPYGDYAVDEIEGAEAHLGLVALHEFLRNHRHAARNHGASAGQAVPIMNHTGLERG